jgi:hypothetical protein
VPDQPRPGKWPTQADIYAAVVRVDRRLAEALVRQDEHDRRQDEHERQLRELDGRVDDLRSWRSLVRGGLALVSMAVVAALATGGAIMAQSIGGG